MLYQNYIFLKKLLCATYSTNTYFELQPRIPYNISFSCHHRHVAMLPLRSTADATTTTVLPLLPPCCHAAATTLPPPLRCCRCHAAGSAAVLPPSCCHHHCHHATATTAIVAKLPLLLQSCHHCHYLYCEIGLMMKKNSVR